MNITFQDPTGDCSFSGQWDGQNYDFNVESLNIMAKQYNAYEVAENLPKELQRAINESKELTRLTKLLPYLSCETPVTFGGKEPPLTCNAANAKELADVIVNWLVDKVRFSLILAWPQAEKNRAAAEALEQAWLPKPLPFAGRIHADPKHHQATHLQYTAPDLTGEILSPGTPQLQSHHELHQSYEADPTVDSQTKLHENTDELLENDHIEQEADQPTGDSSGAEPEESLGPLERNRLNLETFIEENASLTMTSFIDKVAEHADLYMFMKTIGRLVELGELDSLSPTNNARYYAIYITEYYEAEYAHARLAGTDPESTAEDLQRAQALFAATYNYDKYALDPTKDKDQAFMDMIISKLIDPDCIAEMNGYYQQLILIDNPANRIDIFLEMSKVIIKYILKDIQVDLPVSFESGRGIHNRGMYSNISQKIELGSDYFGNDENTLQELITQLVSVLAHECMHYFQYQGIHPDGTAYSDNNRPWQTWNPERIVPYSINEVDYRAHPREAQAFYVKETIEGMLKEQKIIELWISPSSN